MVVTLSSWIIVRQPVADEVRVNFKSHSLKSRVTSELVYNVTGAGGDSSRLRAQVKHEFHVLS